MPKQEEESKIVGTDDVYDKTAVALDGFRLTPKRFNGHEVRLYISVRSDVFPASRELCQQFNLDYGSTVGTQIRILKPLDKDFQLVFWEIYATGNKVDAFRSLLQPKEADLYAQLQFTDRDVKRVRAEFFGRTYYDIGEDDFGDPREVYVAPEGKVILLFTKAA